SLPTHFNALTIQQFSTSLPENYTIEHSSSPIPIASSLNHRRHSTRPDSQSESHGGGRKSIHRCEECGKMYKHPNCLSKHRWEHSEQWGLTSKLLLTKHQQVQMLEAAAILVSMDSSRK
ncbi:hypothetical protein BDB00DRAFT_748811, partial [Zychaea mexicana]|uniref:uncharacterized protein n=1 Tax=Zychaea mexicana TaxID=64656 RepID=UPI0022FED061